MKPKTDPTVYALRGDQRVSDVLEMEAELLRSEGLDPRWPGFEERPEREQGGPED